MSYDELNDYSELAIKNKRLKARINILLEADKIRGELLDEYIENYNYLLKIARSLTYPKTIIERQAVLNKRITELKKRKASKEEIEVLAREYRLLDVLYEV